MAQPTIVVPVYGRLDLLDRCLRAIDRHTFVSIAVLIIDDGGPEPVDEAAVRAAMPSGRRFTLVGHEQNLGFVATVNEAFERCAGTDVVLVNSDVTVLPGWLAGLQDARSASPATATASAIADHGGILSVAALGALRDRSPDAIGERLDHARRVSDVGIEIPVAVGHCTYFSKQALAEVGGFDLAFSPGYGEEVDWSLRGAQLGWRHVAALHSYVWHDGGASFATNPERERLRRRHEARILARYPRSFVRIRRFARDPASPLARSLALLEAALSDVDHEARPLPRVR
ncbi:MAG TPA: glycosyltransferase [Jatrophihabitantaceae bacterium]|jgi:GT2 family glycosyltransferase